MRNVLPVIFGLLLFLNCDLSSDEINIMLYQIPAGILIKNMSDSKVAYLAIEEETLSLINMNRPNCDWSLIINEHEQKTVDSTKILGYGIEKNLIVFFWEYPCVNETIDVKLESIKIEKRPQI